MMKLCEEEPHSEEDEPRTVTMVVSHTYPSAVYVDIIYENNNNHENHSRKFQLPSEDESPYSAWVSIKF